MLKLMSVRGRAAALAAIVVLLGQSAAVPTLAAPVSAVSAPDASVVAPGDATPTPVLGGRSVPDPVTFFPKAPATLRANRPEAVIGFGSRHEPATAALPIGDVTLPSAGASPAGRPAGSPSPTTAPIADAVPLVAPVPTPAPKAAAGADIVVPATTQSIRGHVFDGAGHPIANVQIWASSATAFAFVDDAADGSWSMSVPVGSYTLQVFDFSHTHVDGSVCDAYYPCKVEAATVFVVTAGLTVTVDVTLRERPTVSGTITGANGAPLANVGVRASDGTYTATAADGTYRLALLPGTFSIETGGDETFAPGFYSGTGWVPVGTTAAKLAVGPANYSGIDIQLPYLRSISGRVTDGFGVPRAQVVVTPYTSASYFYGTNATTAADGTFSLRLASTTAWTLRAQDPSSVLMEGWYGPGPDGYTGDPAQAKAIPLADSDISGVEIRMPANPRISGRILRPDGSGIGNASVSIIRLSADNRYTQFSTRTLADGSYSAQAPSGSWAVWAHEGTDTYAPGYYTPGGWTLTLADAGEITTVASDVTDVTFTLPAMVSVSGTVTNPDGTGVRTFVGVDIGALYPTTALSDYEGHWTLRLPPGSWTLEFDATDQTKPGWYGAGGWVGTKDEATPVILSETPVTAIDATLPFWPRITGTVRDAAGKPIPWAEVDLWWPNGSAPTLRSSSHEDGTYRIIVRWPGTYVVKVPSTAELIDSSVPVTIGTDDIPGRDFTIHRNALFTGTVRDTHGEPIAGIQVEYANMYPSPALTDANGRYAFWKPAGQTFGLWFRDPTGLHVYGCLGDNGFSTTASKPLYAVQDTTEDDSIVIPTYRHVSGRIEDAAGAAVPGALVIAIPEGDPNAWAASSPTDTAGAFDLKLVPGSWYVEVLAPEGFASGWLGDQGFNYQPSTAGPFLLDEADFQVDAVLPTNLYLGGRVTHGSTPLAGIEVDLLLNGAAYKSVKTDANGRWRAAVAPGAYLVGVYDSKKTYSHGWIGPSGFTVDPDAGRLVTVAATDVSGIDVSVPVDHTVSGTYRDTSGIKPAGIYLEAWVNGVYYGYTYTKAGGAWSIRVASGKATFWTYGYHMGDGYGTTDAPGWRTSTSLTANAAAAAVTTVGAASVAGVAIVAPHARIITTTVRVNPASPHAVSDAFVSAYEYGADASFDWSDGHGYAQIPVLPGTYRIWSDTFTAATGQPAPTAGGWYKPGGVTPEYGAATKVTPASGGSKVVVTMWPADHITGNVRDRSGHAITSAGIALYANGWFYDSFRTNEYGAFSITVPPGNYRVGYFDRYGLYAEGWLGSSGYVPDYPDARAIVIPSGGINDASISLPTDVPPVAPSGVTAVPYHASARVSWTPPDTTPDRPIIHSTVTASPGGHRCTATVGSSCTVTGLEDGVAYTFTVTATTNVGNSVPSAPSLAIAPLAVPAAATAPVAVPTGTSATVSWVAPDDNGNAITGYLVSASQGGSTCEPEPTTLTSCTFVDLPEGWTTFSVVATNGLGDGPRSSVSAPVPIDVTPPTITPPVVSLRSKVSMTGSAVPVSVTWKASDTVSGIASTQLRLQVGSGALSPLTLASPRAVTWLGTIAAAASLHLHVGATDASGNAADPAVGQQFGLGIQQESGSTVSASGRWTTQSTTSALGGKLRYSTSKGASVSYTFTGRGIAWVARRGTSQGKAAVYLDGKLAATVDLYASASYTRWVAWQKTNTPSARHTIKIVCLGTSGHARVDVDAFVVLR
jgi:hypothetical protein